MGSYEKKNIFFSGAVGGGGGGGGGGNRLIASQTRINVYLLDDGNFISFELSLYHN